MSVIDETLKANERYAAGFALAGLPMPPGRHLAVVACMDARLTVEEMLGLKTGDAHVIRNAGAYVTDDVLRSLVISQRLLGTREVAIISHTDCGMLTFKGDELRERLEKETGASPVTPVAFHHFSDLDSNVREGIRRVRTYPWTPNSIVVRGFVYDVKSGKLREVTA